MIFVIVGRSEKGR